MDPVFGGASLGLAGSVAMLAVQPDGKLLVAGGTYGLARLNADGSTDTSFHTVVYHYYFSSPFNALAVAVQSDGKIILAGNFTQVNGVQSNSIVRLNSDGTTDSSFASDADPAVGANVVTIIIQPDGKILLGGYATTVNGVTTTGLVRLNSDGRTDTGFHAAIDAATLNYSTAPNEIYNVIVENTGKLLIAGKFTQVNGVARAGLARLNADGSVDAAFNPLPNGLVTSLAEQRDGKILVGGTFTPANGYTIHLVRLNTDGSSDPTFYYDGPIPNTSLTIDANGKILLAGQRTDKTTTISRINADGSFDLGFGGDPNGNSVVVDKYVYSVLAQTNGTILLGGLFSTVQGFSCNSVARLKTDGTVDTTYTPDVTSAPNGPVYAMAVQPDGEIIIGGDFTQVQGAAHTYLARLKSDGTPDPDFKPVLTSTYDATNVSAVVRQGDGTILVAGGFTSVNGQTRTNLARLNADGSLDPGFAPTNTGLDVSYLALQADGKILEVTGSLNSDGQLDNRVVRLNADGTTDAGFNGNAGMIYFSGTIYSFALQPDGKILVGGTALFGPGTPILLRFNTDGSRDAGFNANFDSSGNAGAGSLAVQPDGKIVLGGNLRTAAGAATNYLLRLNADGSLDSSFGAKTNNEVYAILVEKGGTLVVGGLFTQMDGAARQSFARLSPDGSLDPFSGADTSVNGTINTLVEQADGKVLLGGSFTSVNGVLRNNLARVNSRVAPDFFDSQVAVGGGFYYEQFPNGNVFGYYNLVNFPIMYHVDLGFEYFLDANDGHAGAYLYDFASNTFFYTSPTFPFPYLYDFSLRAFLYYYPDLNNPGHYNTNGVRYFFNFSTGKIITK